MNWIFPRDMKMTCRLLAFGGLVIFVSLHQVWPQAVIAAEEMPMTNVLRPASPGERPEPSATTKGSGSEPPQQAAEGAKSEPPTSEVISPSTTVITPEEIQLRIQRVQAGSELAEAVKSQVVATYERAIQELAAAEKFRLQAEQFRQRS